MEPTEDLLREAIFLIDQLRSGELSDEELSSLAERLDKILPDPNWFSYTIDHVPEMPAAEIVQKAFAYRPIQL
jgi:hypothetical protein